MCLYVTIVVSTIIDACKCVRFTSDYNNINLEPWNSFILTIFFTISDIRICEYVTVRPDGVCWISSVAHSEELVQEAETS